MLMETKTFKIASALEELIINLKYKVARYNHQMTGTKEVSKRVKDIKAIVLRGYSVMMAIDWFLCAVPTTFV